MKPQINKRELKRKAERKIARAHGGFETKFWAQRKSNIMDRVARTEENQKRVAAERKGTNIYG